jgi:hypothetical protein
VVERVRFKWHNRRVVKIVFMTLQLICVSAFPALAAVGCGLNDPDRDVPRLFKESTSYKTIDFSIAQRGGDPLLRRIENRLGSGSLALYAPIDAPYTIYEIYRGKNKVGYIHGVNQKGQFGGIQVFIVQDLTGRIKTFYIQKITGSSAGKFRDAKFYSKFVGLSLKDFDSYDPVSGKGSGKIAEITNPAPEMETDFYGVLRGLKKNLVLMDEFVFSMEQGKP